MCGSYELLRVVKFRDRRPIQDHKRLAGRGSVIYWDFLFGLETMMLPTELQVPLVRWH